MEVIDVDSHITVAKGLEGTPICVHLLDDGGHSIEFNRTVVKFAPPNASSCATARRRFRPGSFGTSTGASKTSTATASIAKCLSSIAHTCFYDAKTRVAIEAARNYNDALAETIAACKDPSRYLGAAPLPLQDPAAAADEADRAVKQLRMPVVVIGANVRGRNLDLPEFWPFFARVNELNIPIIIHSDGLSPFQNHPAAGDRTGWAERGPFLADYPIWWMLTHPFEHMIAIARIIYSGLLDRFPNLKFILEEGNVGYALYLFDRLEEGREFGELLYGPRVHLGGPKKHPLDYLEHFHWAVESEDSLIGEVIRRWSAERVLFSSDYPHPDTPWPESVAGMQKVLKPFTAADEAKVMWQNAARLLRLSDLG